MGDYKKWAADDRWTTNNRPDENEPSIYWDSDFKTEDDYDQIPDTDDDR